MPPKDTINDRFYKGFHSCEKTHPKVTINDTFYKGFCSSANPVSGDTINIMVLNRFLMPFHPVRHFRPPSRASGNWEFGKKYVSWGLENFLKRF